MYTRQRARISYARVPNYYYSVKIFPLSVYVGQKVEATNIDFSCVVRDCASAAVRPTRRELDWAARSSRLSSFPVPVIWPYEARAHARTYPRTHARTPDIAHFPTGKSCVTTSQRRAVRFALVKRLKTENIFRATWNKVSAVERDENLIQVHTRFS